VEHDACLQQSKVWKGASIKQRPRGRGHEALAVVFRIRVDLSDRSKSARAYPSGHAATQLPEAYSRKPIAKASLPRHGWAIRGAFQSALAILATKRNNCDSLCRSRAALPRGLGSWVRIVRTNVFRSNASHGTESPQPEATTYTAGIIAVALVPSALGHGLHTKVQVVPFGLGRFRAAYGEKS